MKELLYFYLENCNIVSIDRNILTFDYNNDFTFNFQLEYGENYQAEYNFDILSTKDEIDNILSNVERVTTFNIKNYENLNDRAGSYSTQSLKNNIFALLKHILKSYKDLDYSYNSYIDYGDGFCNTEIYTYSLEINNEFWKEIEFAKHLFEFIFHYRVPEFYNQFFYLDLKIKDKKSIKILSTNTKVRRLGYFKILSFFLNENKKVPATIINKKFENYCLKFEKILDENKFKKGLIKETKTGISAKPYINTAQDFEFLNKINNIFNTGKDFKVYQILQNNYTKSSNIFELSKFDKVFFLEIILRYDYFYFSNLLELLFINEKIEYSSLVQIYQDKIIKCLENHKESNKFGDRKVLNDINEIINRIKKWEKPITYLEHIIMPRINWMMDLGLVTDSNKSFEITEIGKKLFNHLCIWNDLNTEEIISPEAFLDRFIIHLFDDCFINNTEKNDHNLDYVLEKLYNYINESFDLFKTLAPNRVTASQAINYTKYKLYLNDNIKVEFQFIKNKLEDKNQNHFIFKFQEQYQDGYIQKKIN